MTQNSPVSLAELKAQLDSGRLDINEVDDDGRAPLHRAIDLGDEDLARRLVEAGADVDLCDRWGNTPLWRAVYHAPDTAAIVEVLLEHGADPTVKNNHFISPIDLAHKMCDDPETATLLATLEAAAHGDPCPNG